jgi:L-threonylcarbamoyladenylate synthase
MSRVHEVDPASPEAARAAIDDAAEAIAEGLLVVFPTETVYAIACRPDDPEATGRLFEAKRRPARLSLPVLTPDVPTAWRLGRRSTVASAFADAFWPGPLTIVLPRTNASAGWDLGERPGTIGLRVPDHPLATALMSRAGPLAATSANVSGEPPVGDTAGLVWTFGDRVGVYLVLPEEGSLEGEPSTVVELARRKLLVLREGAISPDRLRAVARSSWRKPTR